MWLTCGYISTAIKVSNIKKEPIARLRHSLSTKLRAVNSQGVNKKDYPLYRRLLFTVFYKNQKQKTKSDRGCGFLR